MSINHLYKDERPALLLDFANAKTLDPRITFTRNSIGTYVDDMGVVKTAEAAQARIDHRDGDCLGLLIEEQRTNIQLNSAAPITSGGQALVWTTGVTAPDGTSTAVKIAATAVDTQHNITSTIFPSAMPLTDHAWSCFAKADGVNRFTLRNPEMGFCTFDLRDDGTVINPNTEPATIEKIGNGWFRCTVTGTPGSVAYQYNITLNADDETGFTAFLGDGSGGIMFWGWQMEEGDFSTSYIPTSSSTVTRVKDVAKIPAAGLPSFYNEPEGTMISKVSYVGKKPGGALQAQWSFGGASGNSQYGLKLVQYGFNQQYRTGGATAHHINPSIYAGTSTMTNLNNVGVAYALNDLQLTVNGSSAGALTSGFSCPTGATQLDIGNYGDIAGNLHIRSLAYYNTRLNNTALEAMTL